MLHGLVEKRSPPPNRGGYCEGGEEHHLTEGAVMIAFAIHLLRTVPDLGHVAIHPDGEHGKRFQFLAWLAANGFLLTKAQGTTEYGGLYFVADLRSINLGQPEVRWLRCCSRHWRTPLRCGVQGRHNQDKPSWTAFAPP